MEQMTNKFTMRVSTEHIWVGIAGIIFGCIFSGMGICVCDMDTVFYVLIVFVPMVFAGIYLCWYGMVGKIVIEENALIFYRPLFPVKKILFSEISVVRYSEIRTTGYDSGRKKLDGYHNGKKLFSIDENIEKFEVFYSLFAELNKIERGTLKEEFVIKAPKRNVFSNVFMVVFFGGCFIAMLLWEGEEPESIYGILLAAFTLLGLWELSETLLWRVSVTYNTVSVRNNLGKIKTYPFREITYAKEEKNHIILYSDRRKIVKICKDYENVALLWERLKREESRL